MCGRLIARFNSWWESAHGLACLVFFIGKLISIASEIIGPVSDIATVVVYFHAGNRVWGSASAVFVGLGYLTQLLHSITLHVEHGMHGDNASLLFNRVCNSRVLTCLCGCLHLTTTLYHVDDFCDGFERYREHGAGGVRQTGSRERRRHITNMALAIFKCAPNLMLHGYILMVNQLSPMYVSHRIRGWSLAAQLISTLFGAFTVSTGVTGIITADDGENWGAAKKIALQAVGFLDTASAILRVTIFVAGFHAWLALAVGAHLLTTTLFHMLIAISYMHPRSPSMICDSLYYSSMCACLSVIGPNFGRMFNRFLNDFLSRYSCLALMCFWECVIVTGLFVSLPFILTPRGTVFEHGICTSLDEVNTTGNCIPRAVMIPIIIVLPINVVSDQLCCCCGAMPPAGIGPGTRQLEFELIMESYGLSWLRFCRLCNCSPEISS